MSLIEGIGDEVTVLATCLIALAVIAIAWTSTRVDVRMHTSVVIIDRERFGELLRRVRGIAARSHVAGEPDSAIPPHSSASAAEAHAAADSLLVSGAAASAHIQDIKPHISDGDDDHQSNESETEASSSPNDTCGSSLQCESASSVRSCTDCTESVSSPHVADETATAAADNQNASQHSSALNSDTPPGSIQVRLQFVDGRQRTVVASPDDTIGHFKRYNSSVCYSQLNVTNNTNIKCHKMCKIIEFV